MSGQLEDVGALASERQPQDAAPAPPRTGGTLPTSLIGRLLAQPRRFRFDAAVRLLLHWRRRGDVAGITRFRTPGNLSYPPADMLSVTPDQVVTGVGGLTGPSGLLPRAYTEHVMRQARGGAEALHSFLDMLAHRMLAGFAQAGIKYRPYRAAEQAPLGGPPDVHRAALLALTGRAAPQDDALEDFILHHAGAFAAWPRSAERLEAILSDWAGRPVRVEQFVGAWLDIPPQERTRLPKARGKGQFARLGIDAAIGARAWDPQANIILRVDPMPFAAFQGLMPLQPLARQLAGLARAYLGPSAAFALNPVLVTNEIPGVQLGSPRRLGWDTWMTQSGAASPRRDAAEAVFPARLIERRRAA